MSQDQEQIELGPACIERYFCGDAYPLLAALGVAVAGHSDLAGHYRVKRRTAQHLIKVSLAGSGWGGPTGAPQPLPAGTVLLVPAQQPYRLETLAGQPWQTAWALLEPEAWRDFPAELCVLPGADVAALAPLLQLLHQERFRSDAAADELRHSLSQALVSTLRRLLPLHRADPAAQARLQSLFAEVEARPEQDWSVQRLGERLGCSRSHLHRRCVEAFGRGPAAQVQAVRMRQAEYWLRATGLPLKVIGARLGYTNPYHFSAAFKRHNGRAPAVFRSNQGAR